MWYIDLGRSNAGQEGLVDFKRGFGAEEADLLALSYDVQLATRHREDAQRLLHELTQMLMQPGVPDALVEQAGTLLYRHFP